jgi:hypothetical protein
MGNDNPRLSPVRSQSLSASPSPSPSATPSSPRPAVSADPVQAAVESLFALVDRGVADERITTDAAEEIHHGVDEALDKLADGDAEEAIDKLEEVRHKVEEFVDHGEIANSYREKLDRAIEAIEAQIPED